MHSTYSTLRRAFDDERKRHHEITRRLNNPQLFLEYYMGKDRVYFPWYNEADQMLKNSGWYQNDGQQKYAAIMVPSRCGKTFRYSVLEGIMDVCKDRYHTHFGVISKSKDKAKNFTLAIKKHLEKNDRIIEDFGEFIDKSRPWNTEEMWVTGHDESATTPTFTNIGSTGQVESMGFTHLILDDLVDLMTSLSPAETQKMFESITGTYMTRLEPEGKFMVIGHRFAFRDAYSQILPLDYFRNSTFFKGALNSQEESNFPYRYSTAKYLLDKRNMSEAKWAAIFQQKPIEGGNEFDIQWLLKTVTDEMPKVIKAYVDPAYSTSKKADYMGGNAMGKLEDGRKCVVGMMALRVASNFTAHVKRFYDRSNASGGSVETNNAKTFGDTLRTAGIPLKDCNSTTDKIYRIGELQPLMKNGDLVIHSSVLETEKWNDYFVEEMLYFPNGAHEHILDSMAQGVEDLDGGSGLAYGML